MATPAFLLRLMGHAALSRTVKLGPEDTEAYRFANALRAAVLEGRLHAVWTHPANELAGFTTVANGKRRVPLAVAIAKALGLITGSSDYWFCWSSGSGLIEFKSATGSLSPSQRDMRDWCEAQGVRFVVARSCEQGLEILRGWGVLT